MAKRPTTKPKTTAKAGTNKGGRPPYVPTAADRNVVRNARALLGIAEKDIARIVGIDPDTLKKHFTEELETATHRMHMRVAGIAFAMVTGSPAEYDNAGNKIKDEVKPNPNMVQYFLSRKLKWRESEPVPDQTIKSDAVIDGINIADCTDEELAVLERIVERKLAAQEAHNGATTH